MTDVTKVTEQVPDLAATRSAGVEVAKLGECYDTLEALCVAALREASEATTEETKQLAMRKLFKLQDAVHIVVSTAFFPKRPVLRLHGAD